jgi:hypothetical protein
VVAEIREVLETGDTQITDLHDVCDLNPVLFT